MAFTEEDYNKIWASNSPLPEYTFSDDDYLEGWNFVGELPPSRTMWDAFKKDTDLKMKDLYGANKEWCERAETASANAENSAELAEDWATKTDGTVDGNEYSAKHYANEANSSATASANSATNSANSATSATNTANALINFLETKETLTAPAVDPTLTISGAAADAEVTGSAISDIYYRKLFAGNIGQDIQPFLVNVGDVLQIFNDTSQAGSLSLRTTSDGENLVTITIPANGYKEVVSEVTAYFGRAYRNASGTIKAVNASRGYVGTINENYKLNYIAETSALDEMLCFYADPSNLVTVFTKDKSPFTAQKIKLYDSQGNELFSVNLAGFGCGRTVQIGNYRAYYAKITGGTAQDIVIINKTKYAGNFIIETNNKLDEIVIPPYYQIILDTPDSLVIEGDERTGTVYFRYNDNLQIRPINNRTVSISDLATELSQTLVTSTNGVENCISIPNTYVLAYDTSTNLFVVIARGSIQAKHIVLIAATSGRIIYVHQNLINAWNLKKNPIDTYGYYGSTIERLNVTKNSDFSFIHFSDIHAGEENMKRIVDFANGLGTIATLSTVINSGDTVATILDDGVAWYDTIANDSTIDILTCVGNHDVWTGSTWTKADAKDIYDAEIAPMVSRVNNVIQPANAATNGYCYYYKDYSNVRVIVLNCMVGDVSVNFWDSTQKTWFESVLADAITNDKAVICVNHAPFSKTAALRDERSNWTSWLDYRSNSFFDEIVLSNEAVEAVDTFINNGGMFICWLTGHTHTDNILTHQTYENQIMVNIATARYNYHTDGQTFDNTFSGYYDCFNYCAVDTTNHIFKMWRVGWNMDSSMKVRVGFSYNYATHTILHD